MSRKRVINCRSREEMNSVADRMAGQGFCVKTVERWTPFHPYGLCVLEYRVIIREEPKTGGFLRSIIWKSDFHKTSVLSESSIP